MDDYVDYNSDSSSEEINPHQKASSWQSIQPKLPNPQPPWIIEETCRVPHRKTQLKALDVVELMGNSTYQTYWDHRDGDFLLIRRILRNVESDEVKLVGQRFRRNCYMAGMLSDADDVNEVCLLMSSSRECRRSALPVGLHEVSLNQVFKVRELFYTNLLFPDLKSRACVQQTGRVQNRTTSERHLRDSGRLICRWVFFTQLHVADMESAKLYEGTLRRLYLNDICALGKIESSFAASEDQLLLDSLGYLPSFPEPGTKRASFDAFCGAGGISQALIDAGFYVAKAVDLDSNACATYRANHLDTELYQASIEHGFAVAFPNPNSERIEVAHVSTVCKPFSQAHTIRGRDDEKNEATLFCVGRLLQVVRPRILSLEQTDGLVTRHQQFFRALINMITSVGYSLRWKIVHLNEYGGAQERKRLIIFASCPGGTLPDFPRPTHGPRSKYKLPFNSVGATLAPIDLVPEVTFHDTQHAARRMQNSTRPHPRANLNGLLRHCITTQGPIESHPTEQRYFTIRDTASLQGFKVSFKFVPGQSFSAIMTQIGNAVPPVAAEQLFREILRTLDEEDRDRARRMGDN